MGYRRKKSYSLESDPLWYKNAVIYEIHIRAFCDGNGDGVGDFQGLTQRLDYLQDLGVTALWLLPFYPSPLRDDGYDISDYTGINRDYGTLQDFKVFLKEAHQRGLRVITELVINHTSDQHPWFQRARRAKPGSSARDFYVWSDTPERYKEARIIFKDFEASNWTWDPIANAYYWHRFYFHQPDLNFDSPDVKKAVFGVLDFWLEMGIDGLRLDAVPYLYEREGTNCENLPETHAFLKELRQYVDQNYECRVLLAEANQWPEDAAAYFGSGDECHMAFHFPLMPRLFMAIHMEDRYPIIDILDQTPQIPENSQWALFLRNHDELTLEMVTDEDRDYMYRVYAHDPRARINLGIRRRLAPLLGNHRRKFELMKCLLFSLPGTPVIYYGDEIGMGDNIYLGDRNGVRTPMQWSADRNAGFSQANPQRLYLPVIIDPEYHYNANNVETEQQNLHSLLWWIKRLILLRKRFQAFGQGSIEFLYPENQKVLVFIRARGNEVLLVVANLSRFVQFAELDLSAYKGMVPVELFGHTYFPPIGESPYFITLGPHAFYLFKIERQMDQVDSALEEGKLATLEVTGSWVELLAGRAKPMLERILPTYLRHCRWFGGKARSMRSARVAQAIPASFDSITAYLTFIEVQYAGGLPETYLLPLSFASGEHASELSQESPGAIVARIRVESRGRTTEGALFDALFDHRFANSLLEAISRRRRFKNDLGEVLALPSRVFRKLRGDVEAPLDAYVLKGEQSNTCIVYGDRFILKAFRRIQEGVNPDVEIGRFITERTSFSHIPPLAGAFEYHRKDGEPLTLGILQGWVPNQGDAWRYTQDTLARYFEEALAKKTEVKALALPQGDLPTLMTSQIPPLAEESIGAYLESARLLGQRTGELHVALASETDDPAFAPEPFTPFYRLSLAQSMRRLVEQSLSLLSSRLKSLPEEIRPEAERVLGLKKEILSRLQLLRDRSIRAMRIRCHGDYHLGQVLYTGKDFVIMDFEGEPARPVSERRIKRSPLTDVAGMLRSFHYASVTKLNSEELREEDRRALEPWARLWVVWVSVSFLKSYVEVTRRAAFLPDSAEDFRIMLGVFLLEKAVYELGYELNNRPDWVRIPLQGILQLLETTAE